MKFEPLKLYLASPTSIESEEPYSSPHKTTWIVSVGYNGKVSILKAPPIHPGFFDCGTDAETVGLPFERFDLVPGVYQWTCSLWQSRDWESGVVDDHGFDVIEETPLYLVDANSPKAEAD